MAPEPPQPPDSHEVPLVWVGADEVPISYANQFMIQFQPEDGFVLTVGQATGPALIGDDPEELARQLAEVEFVPVRPLMRVAMTEKKMRELAASLEVTLRKFEQLRQLQDPRGNR